MYSLCKRLTYPRRNLHVSQDNPTAVNFGKKQHSISNKIIEEQSETETDIPNTIKFTVLNFFEFYRIVETFKITLGDFVTILICWLCILNNQQTMMVRSIHSWESWIKTSLKKYLVNTKTQDSYIHIYLYWAIIQIFKNEESYKNQIRMSHKTFSTNNTYKIMWMIQVIQNNRKKRSIRGDLSSKTNNKLINFMMFWGKLTLAFKVLMKD